MRFFHSKRARWFLLILPIGVLFGVLRWKTQQPEYVLRKFSERQARRLSTRDCAVAHLQALRDWKWTQTPDHAIDLNSSQYFLLWLSWYGDKHSLYEWSLNEFGQLTASTTINGNGSYEGCFYFTTAELNNLRHVIDEFPTGVSPAPDIEDVLFVSYRDGNSWQARVYDRRNLPAPVRDLLQWPEFKQQKGSSWKIEKPDSAT